MIADCHDHSIVLLAHMSMIELICELLCFFDRAFGHDFETSEAIVGRNDVEVVFSEPIQNRLGDGIFRHFSHLLHLMLWEITP
jgi:hypothetical protein